MDIRTLHQTGDVATLEQLRELLESANTRVERDVVQLMMDALGPRPGVALGSVHLLMDEHLPWLERRTVLRARTEGMSWAGIARLLGRSRQSVHERFVRPLPVSAALPPAALRRPDPDATDRQDAARQHSRATEADQAGLERDLVPW